MQALNSFNNAVQNVPFYDQITGIYQDKVDEKFGTKDPFYEKIPEKPRTELKPGEEMEYSEVRRQPPPNITEDQRKLWKKIMKRAWYHDRNFCGCMPIDLGCGMISCVSIFPIIGSIIAYKMHYKLIKMCNQAGAPAKIQAEMVANIGLDFLISLVPLLGVLLSWMKSSSTRNAALFDTWLREQSDEVARKHAATMKAPQPTSVSVSPGTQAPNRGQQRSDQQRSGQQRTGPSRNAQQHTGQQSRSQQSRPQQSHPQQSRPNQSSAPNRQPVGQHDPSAQTARAAGPTPVQKAVRKPVASQPVGASSQAQSQHGSRQGTPLSQAEHGYQSQSQPQSQQSNPHGTSSGLNNSQAQLPPPIPGKVRQNSPQRDDGPSAPGRVMISGVQNRAYTVDQSNYNGVSAQSQMPARAGQDTPYRVHQQYPQSNRNQAQPQQIPRQHQNHPQQYQQYPQQHAQQYQQRYQQQYQQQYPPHQQQYHQQQHAQQYPPAYPPQHRQMSHPQQMSHPHQMSHSQLPQQQNGGYRVAQQSSFRPPPAGRYP